MVEDMGHNASYALTLKEGLKLASSDVFDVIFLDIRMPDGNGLDLLPKIHELPSRPEVIIITGLGDPDGSGDRHQERGVGLHREVGVHKGNGLSVHPGAPVPGREDGTKPLAALKLNGIVGSRQRMQDSLDLLAQAAYSEANVLIVGETGTGKEVFARAIHDNSSGPRTILW